jgi:CxxC motif-containing protein (DUF1111 family)
MHDGETLTFTEAILRHAGQASGPANGFRNLSSTRKQQLIDFLGSL